MSSVPFDDLYDSSCGCRKRIYGGNDVDLAALPYPADVTPTYCSICGQKKRYTPYAGHSIWIPQNGPPNTESARVSAINPQLSQLYEPTTSVSRQALPAIHPQLPTTLTSGATESAAFSPIPYHQPSTSQSHTQRWASYTALESAIGQARTGGKASQHITVGRGQPQSKLHSNRRALRKNIPPTLNQVVSGTSSVSIATTSRLPKPHLSSPQYKLQLIVSNIEPPQKIRKIPGTEQWYSSPEVMDALQQPRTMAQHLWNTATRPTGLYDDMLLVFPDCKLTTSLRHSF